MERAKLRRVFGHVVASVMNGLDTSHLVNQKNFGFTQEEVNQVLEMPLSKIRDELKVPIPQPPPG